MSDSLPDCELFLKLEELNPAGSIKLKTANAIVEDAEQRGVLRQGGRVIESSSGNLGISLSMVCAAKGYRFTSPAIIGHGRALRCDVGLTIGSYSSPRKAVQLLESAGRCEPRPATTGERCGAGTMRELLDRATRRG